MIGTLESFLKHWLGDANSLGAASWLQAFTWVAAVAAVIIAGVSLRRQSLQSRATLLLNLFQRWEDLAEQRRQFSEFYRTTRVAILQRHSTLQNKHQVEHMRSAFQDQLSDLLMNNNSKFLEFFRYVNFFELVGTYVGNGYLPIKDIAQLYDEPIFELDIVWRDFIKVWQKEAHARPGLLGNALYLMEEIRIRSEYPLYYRTIHKIVRHFV